MQARNRSFDGRFAAPGKAMSAKAAHAAKQLELAARKTDSSDKGGTVELQPLFQAYLAHLERKGRDVETISRNGYSLERLNAWLGELGVDPIDATEVLLEEYVAWLSSEFAETTASRETAHLKAAFRYGVRLGMLERNPAADIEAPKVAELEPEVYSNEQLRRMRAAVCTDLEEVIFYALAYSGVRRHELVELAWEAVAFDGQFLTVRGKGGKLRRVPLHPTLAEVLAIRLRRYPGSEKVLGPGGSLRNVNAVLARLLERAGVDGGNRPAHRFRKTVATVLYEEGVQTDAIDKIMGWAPTSIRSRYYTRVADRSLYEAILRLYCSDPIERTPLRLVAGPGKSSAPISDDVQAVR